ncbi:hypothetical protein VKT23_010100 [Stygiomarasmius scandens]|uniref:F-box domain-containing protein n=1 Tax=Marasmiellus scandens TaxID=2682957 RepID=A0ABR1JHU8_9AGAR
MSPKSKSTNAGPLCAQCRNEIVAYNSLSDVVSKYLATADALLSCNDPPPGNDLDSMRTSLGDAQKRIRDIEQQLKALEEQRQILERERNTLYKYASTQKAVLNPIRRIPVEILAEIFTISVKSATSNAYENALTMKSARWILSHVCARWRGISLTTPSLWTNIELELSKENAAFSPRAFLLGLHIQRSKHLPLEIGLYSYASDIPQSHYLLTMLLPTASRWETLHTDMKPECLQACLAPMSAFLSNLVHFYTYHLIATKPNSEAILPPAQINPNERPVVCDALHQSVMLRDVVLRMDVCRFKFPVEHIQTLALIHQFYTINDLLSALRPMVNLQELTLTRHSVFLGQIDEDIDHLPVQLPNLRFLNLSDDKERLLPLEEDEEQDLVVSRFLDLLTLSALETLEDEHIDSANTQNFSAFLSLFERSRCDIKSFSTSTIISEDGFICLIREYPSLMHLDLRGVEGFKNQAMTELTFQDDADWECLVPSLESLELQGSMSFDATAFVDMIESRLRGYRAGKLCKIRKAKLGWLEDPPADEDVFDRLDGDFFRGFSFTKTIKVRDDLSSSDG